MIEIIREPAQGKKEVALFDFDGTLSLIRRGWQEVMISYMVEVLQETPRADEEDRIRELVREFVTELTGKQTIYQMIRLAEEVKSRNGSPREPLEYKKTYHSRLSRRMADRIEALENGKATPDTWLLPGSRAFLEALRGKDLDLYLASGTDLTFVRRECELLEIDHYFGDRIFGAIDDYQNFSKRQVIQEILQEFTLDPRRLVSFGDGYVEIEETKKAGGVAVGVASDEEKCRDMDPWKRERLIRAGADLLIPHFLNHRSVMDRLEI